jgi:hypothetical protein
VSEAQATLASNDVRGSCSTLSALMNELSAQSGRRITSETASSLIADVARIRAVLAC